MKRADGFLYRFRRSPKRFSRAVFALFLSVSAFFAGCDLFNNSMVDYFEDNTGVAEVKGVVPASGIRMMANETVLIPPAVLPGDTTTLTLSLSNPRNFTVRHTLSVVTSDNGIITVDQTGPNKIEIDITGAELDDEYDLTLAMKSPDGLRDFTPYHIPVRCVSFNTALKDLSVDIPGAGAVHPVQKDGAFELNVPAAAAAVTLRAETLEAPYAALSPNNTVPLTSGSSAVEQSLPLVLGMNTFYVKVTAASTDTKVYPVKIFKGDASKAITAFTVTSPVNAAGTITGTAVTVTVPYGTNISALNNASVEIIHTGVKIVSLSPHEERTGSPAGFDSQNLAVPRFYQVMAEDGSAMDYTVTVTEAQNSAKEITEFYFTLNSKKYGAGTGAEAGSGSISGTAINVKVPYKTALTGLAPAVTVSAGALVDPPPGTAKDFTSPQTYTVTAEDGGTGTYTVTVTAAKIASVTAVSGNFTGADGFTQSGGAVSGAAIKAKITSVTGTDSLGTITLDPADYSVDNLTGVTAGSSPNATLRVDAAKSSAGADITKPFAVYIKKDAKAITEFYFTIDSKKYGAGTGTEANTGTIDEAAKTISLRVPHGAALTSLTPAVTVSAGASVDPPAGAWGSSNSKTYTVRAEDGTTQDYAVTVGRLPYSGNNLQDAINTASDGIVTLPAGTMTLTGSITIGSGKTITIKAEEGTATISRGSGMSGSLESLFWIDGGGSLTLDGGGGSLILDGGNNPSNNNELVRVQNGSLTMNDGVTLQNNYNGNAYGGGGVCLMGGGTFTMNGGTITDNTADENGGGVYVDSGTFTMNGGTITGNTARNGGGVSVVGGTFNMIGGTITGNTATSHGGGVYNSGGTVPIPGGTVSGNTPDQTYTD